MKLGLFLKELSIYKQWVALSLALHSLAFTGILIYCHYPIRSSHHQESLAIKMIFIKEQKSLIQALRNSSSIKLKPISTLDSSLSSNNQKRPKLEKKVMKTADFHPSTIAKKEIVKDVSSNCENNSLYKINSQKYSPASFQGRQFKNLKPHYPRRARELGFEGVVVVQVKVSKAGKSVETRLLSSSGYSLLDTAALDALSQWSFIPARIGCYLVESNLKICIRFSLTDANSTEILAS